MSGTAGSIWKWAIGAGAAATAGLVVLGNPGEDARATGVPEPTRVARYVVEERGEARPRVIGAELAVTVGSAGSGPWITWRAELADGRSFSFSLQLREDSAVSFPPPVEAIERYVLTPADGPSLEFVDAASGGALLPRFRFEDVFLPRAGSGEAAGSELPAEIVWAGRRFRRGEEGDPSRFSASDPRRLELDGSRRVGTTRSFRDDGSGRRGGDRGDYEWAELAAADYDTLMAAGVNTFRVPEAHLTHVRDRPVFFLMHEGLERHPDLLLRSNYLGPVMYMDEPAIRLFHRGALERSRSPREASEFYMDVVRGRYERDGGYGSRHLDRLLRSAGYDFGPGEWRQPDYPVFEAVPSAAWYALEAGVPAFVHEGRIRSERFAEIVRKRLGVDFPDDPESGVLFQCSLLRGPARWFDAEWGLAIYGQMEESAKDLAFRLSEERGATLFFIWSSDHGHHVPWSRQIDLFTKSSRQGSAGSRAARATEGPILAETAVILPRGYLCGESALTPQGVGGAVGLWGAKELALGKDNGHGAKYGDVLAAAYREFARLLRDREEFDVLYLPPAISAEGYRREIWIDADATVRRRER